MNNPVFFRVAEIRETNLSGLSYQTLISDEMHICKVQCVILGSIFADIGTRYVCTLPTYDLSYLNR